MSNPAVYTDSVGYPPSNSTALRPVNGDPTALVADATDPDTIVNGPASGFVVFAVSTSSLNQSFAPMSPNPDDPVNVGDFLRMEAVDTSSFATARGMT